MEEARKIIVIGVLLLFALVAWLSKRSMKKQSKVALAAGETRIAEAWVETRDITFKGLTLVGNALTGKLVLTNRRLLYTNVNEQKVALELQPVHVVGVAVGEKGMLSKSPTLVLDYDAGKRKPKRATFVQIGAVSGSGLTQTFEADGQTPLSSLAARLDTWRTQGAA